MHRTHQIHFLSNLSVFLARFFLLTMPVIWDPRSVLDVYPGRSDFTCVGTTKKGRRCGQLLISKSDLERADSILDNLEMREPSAFSLAEELTELAALTLCPRWHRKESHSQVTEVSQGWANDITRYAADLEARTDRSRRTHVERHMPVTPPMEMPLLTLSPQREPDITGAQVGVFAPICITISANTC